MTTKSQVSFQRAYNCLLGGAYGEFLGSQVKNLKGVDIKKIFLKEIVPTDRCSLTGGWEMTFALAKAIIVNKKIDVLSIHNTYLEFFNPNKGYSESVRQIFLHARTYGFSLPPGESKNSDCLMRISPLAISGSRNIAVLMKQVTDCTYFTHSTIEATTCTLIFCSLLQYLLNGYFDYEHIKKVCLSTAEYFCNELYVKLQLTFQRLEETTSFKLVPSIEKTLMGSFNLSQTIKEVSATDCLCCSLYYFLRYRKNPLDAIQKAIYGGVASDTVAKLVGELCGAYNEECFVPNDIEHQMKSFVNIKELASSLIEIRVD